MKKILAAAMALLLLAGCGPKVEPFESAKPREEISLPTPTVIVYPVLQAVETEGLELDTASRNGITISFPKDDWFYDGGLGGLLSIYGAHYTELDQMYNINVQKLQMPNTDIDEEFLSLALAELSTFGSYYTITDSDIYMMRDEKVILIDYKLEFSDECIDLMIELGAMTEAEIDAIGGREVLKSIPPTTQVLMYQSTGDGVYQYTGTYYNGEQRQMILDCFTVIAATIVEE